VPCTLASKCVNCGQDHAAFDKRCPKWILEKEVQKITTIQKISFPQARRIAEQTKGPVTYASVSSLSPQPRSSPRKKLQLDPRGVYSQSQLSSTLNSQSSSPSKRPKDKFEELFQFAKQHNKLDVLTRASRNTGLSSDDEVASVTSPMDTHNNSSNMPQKRKTTPNQQAPSTTKTARKEGSGVANSKATPSGRKAPPPSSKKSEQSGSTASKSLNRSFHFK